MKLHELAPDTLVDCHFTVGSFDVYMYADAGSDEARLLTEAKNKGAPIGGKYSAQLHRAHGPEGQDHIHCYARNNQLFALNKDGSAHDRSHQTRIPNKVAAAIRAKFPDFALPPDNFIESAAIPAQVRFLVYQKLLLLENDG